MMKESREASQPITTMIWISWTMISPRIQTLKKLLRIPSKVKMTKNVY